MGLILEASLKVPMGVNQDANTTDWLSRVFNGDIPAVVTDSKHHYDTGTISEKILSLSTRTESTRCDTGSINAVEITPHMVISCNTRSVSSKSLHRIPLKD